MKLAELQSPTPHPLISCTLRVTSAPLKSVLDEARWITIPSPTPHPLQPYTPQTHQCTCYVCSRRGSQNYNALPNTPPTPTLHPLRLTGAPVTSIVDKARRITIPSPTPHPLLPCTHSDSPVTSVVDKARRITIPSPTPHPLLPCTHSDSPVHLLRL